MAKASQKRILVVDDEPDVRRYLVACIQDAGFKVETASDGLEALEKIKANAPDLITLDMVMPRHSGINVMRKLRKNEAWAHIPVIIITAHAKDEFGSKDVKELQAFTARHRPKFTFEKPITPERLVKAICEILGVKVDVEVEEKKDQEASREEIAKMLGKADDEALKKIREMLK